MISPWAGRLWGLLSSEMKAPACTPRSVVDARSTYLWIISTERLSLCSSNIPFKALNITLKGLVSLPSPW